MGGAAGIRNRGIVYRPLPSQRIFHELTTRFKGFSGPIGSGKSQALCQEAIRLTYLNPGRIGLLGSPTYPMLRDTTLTTLFEILNSNEIPYEHNKGENSLLMKETGSRILFRAVDEFDRLRGMNLAWFGLDELTCSQEEAWLLLQGRLRDLKAKRLCGFAAWTPKGFDWVYRRFIQSPQEDCGVVRARPYENRHLLAQVGDYYERLKDSYDPKFFEQEVLGEYLAQDGTRVYTAFNPAVNVRELEVDPNTPLLWAMDFNVDPMSSVIVQVLGKQVKVVDEIVLRQSTTLKACEEFLRRYPGHSAGLHIYGDASGHQQQTTGFSDYQMMQAYLSENSLYRPSYRTPRQNPMIQQRVNLLNAKLLSARGDSTLLVDPRCKELIKDFEEVCYRLEDNKLDKDRDRMRTHTSDALGYLLWQECRGGQHIGERPERICF